MKKFSDWLKKRNKTCDFFIVSPEELNELLRRFYAEVKSARQGSSLSPSTLTCLRAAIHRHITGVPYNRPINILADREFLTSNNMFNARCKLYVKEGNSKPKHKPSIGEGDMEKLSGYFKNWTLIPDVLTEAMWFHLCFFLVGVVGKVGLKW